MVNTEINILDHIQLSEQNIDIITLAAKEDAVKKLIKITELIESIKSAAKEDSLKKLNTILYDVYENDLKFSFEIICRVKISKK